MGFKVNKDELILTLESILETQDLVAESTEESALEGVPEYETDWLTSCGVAGQGNVKEYVSDWLLLLMRFPLKSDYYELSDEQAYFIMDYYE